MGRIKVLDILRGVAIATIMVIHSSNNFLYSSGRVENCDWLAMLDACSKNIIYFLIEGKAYAIFALLFGFTFALQYNNQLKKGKDFGCRMVWRMMLLILFGFINAFFFAGGDPLIFYAVAMLLVVPLRNIGNNALISLSLLLFLQPIELINSILPFIKNLHYSYYGELVENVANGDFWRTGFVNITSGVKGALLWAVETGRFTQTLGLFLLGIWLYRCDYISLVSDQLKKHLMLLIVSSFVLYIVNKFLPYPLFMMNYKLTFALSISLIIVLLSRRYCDSRIFVFLQNYGRLSLTNFVMQSVIGSFLFYPWGLNLANHLGVTLSALLGMAIVIIQIILSNIWVKKVGKGPLEALWHKLTWI